MKIALLSPYGMLSPESGLLYVIARYAVALGHEVVDLRCNGCVSVCERDAESEWNRQIDQCSGCESESRSLAAWAGISAVELSDCISSEVRKSIHAQLLFLNAEQSWSYPIKNSSVSLLAADLFLKRFAREKPDFSNRNHEFFCKKTASEVLILERAFAKFSEEIKADLFLVAGQKTVFAQAAQLAWQEQKKISFIWDLAERADRISPSWHSEQLLCSLLLERVTGMRPDVKTWPSELLSILREIATLMQIVPAGATVTTTA